MTKATHGGTFSILAIGDLLLVSTGADLRDVLALELKRALTERVRSSGARAVVLDISAVEVIDSYMTRVLNDIGQCVGFLGASCLLVGMRPAVAMTLVAMGIDLSGVRTALSLEAAVALLERPR